MKTYIPKIWKCLVLLFFLYGCSDDNGEHASGGTLLSITTTIETRAVTTAFVDGDQMSVFVRSEASIDSEEYADPSTASYNGSSWSLFPQVSLSAKDVYVSAFCPAVTAVNPAAIPITVASQTDFLYSGTGVVASEKSPQAVLNMKHALPMLAFNIMKDGASGESKLTAIRLQGESLQTEGTLNIADGNITGTKNGDYIINCEKTVVPDGWTEQLPQMFCFPFVSTGDNVSLICTIDDQEYTVVLPEIAVESGMKYLFRLRMKEDALEILGTEVISLNEDTDVMPDYRSLTIDYSGTEVILPEITGENQVNGTVWWDKSLKEAYSFPLSHIYATDDTHQVRIEVSGGTIARFEQLDNIDIIDFSDF